MLLEKIVILIAIVVSYFLQTSVDFFRIGHIKPDLLLILTIYFALYKGSFAGIWVGFLGGLLQDMNIGGYLYPTGEAKYYLGTHALPKTLIGFFVGKIAGQIQKEGAFVLFLIHLIAGIAKGVLEFIEVSLFHSGQSAQVIGGVLLPESFYTAIVAVVWFKVLHWAIPQEKTSV
ncbi:MAG: rod shape-determining protein MreD [Leptospiraceae bacterium]|nr:rod shape-determining protein MreD [Leptospiraceae bacterium]MDW8306812.1 rod shape-determining protein MreD [Leptospiraceae bacterium]